MAGRINQVQLVFLPVQGLVVEPDGGHLDRDAALALDVHRVEELLLHVPPLDRPGELQEPVGQRRLAVVNVGDDAKVADVLLVVFHALYYT